MVFNICELLFLVEGINETNGAKKDFFVRFLICRGCSVDLNPLTHFGFAHGLKRHDVGVRQKTDCGFLGNLDFDPEAVAAHASEEFAVNEVSGVSEHFPRRHTRQLLQEGIKYGLVVRIEKYFCHTFSKW
jgi:hypothetical protein